MCSEGDCPEETKAPQPQSQTQQQPAGQQQSADQRTETQLPDSDQLRRARLAAYLHDEVSGPLSLAAREAQRQIRLADARSTAAAGADPSPAFTDDQRSAWKTVNTDITRALRNLYRLVAGLLDANRDSNASITQSVSAAAFFGELQRTVERERQCLADLGFTGKASVTGRLTHAPNAATGEEIQALVHELCTNVHKHCTSADSVYELSVHCAGDRIEISELCQWTSQSRETAAPEVGGQGLSAHRLIIRHIGGELVWHSGQWQWNCYARIPIFTETESGSLRGTTNERYRE